MAFARADRLLKAAHYQFVFAKPRRSRDHLWTVLARASAHGEARLGMAISKKVARKAVQRNRLKRLVRENFRQRRQGLGATDFVVLANRAATTATAQELRASLNKHWRKLHAARTG